jgi:hypothetical protein
MKRWLLLSALLLAVGCDSGHKETSTPAGETKPVSHSAQEASFSGGDGSSIENAVIIKAPNNFIGVRAEYNWIRKNHPNWQLDQQSVLKGSGKVYDKMYFRTPDGQRTILFINVTDFYGKK